VKVDQFGQPLYPCETCGTDTRMGGTRRCDACWEVEHRLRCYMRSDKAIEFVEKTLADAKARRAKEGA
jgi:hypothetical protein